MKRLLLLIILFLAVFSTIHAEELKKAEVSAANNSSAILTQVPADVEELSIKDVNKGQPYSHFDVLVNFPDLVVLKIRNEGKETLKPDQIAEIAQVDKIEKLIINEKVEQGLSSLQGHPSLEVLHLEQDYQDPQWGKIPNPKGPSNVYGCVVKPKYKNSTTNYIREDLAKIPQLKELSILHFSVTAPWNFEALQGLETLILMEPNFTSKGKEQFKESILPHLKKLVINGYQQPKSCFRLKDPDLTEINLFQVAPLLEHLNLVKTKTTDQEIAGFANSTSLVYVNLSKTQVTKEVLVSLSTIPTLEEIYLNSVNLRGADFTLLADLPRLKILSVQSKMDLADILTLTKLDGQLQELHISGGIIASQEIVDYLKSNMPNTKIVVK